MRELEEDRGRRLGGSVRELRRGKKESRGVEKKRGKGEEEKGE